MTKQTQSLNQESAQKDEILKETEEYLNSRKEYLQNLIEVNERN